MPSIMILARNGSGMVLHEPTDDEFRLYRYVVRMLSDSTTLKQAEELAARNWHRLKEIADDFKTKRPEVVLSRLTEEPVQEGFAKNPPARRGLKTFLKRLLPAC
ncbi:MAG TPA: hypothetical protein VHF05_01830 [Candidatus Paceibacterota bacterium]|jgi:hypothetical protein|nr:hypothetical protein [Candidatus Paceibacterota bacterium]